MIAIQHSFIYFDSQSKPKKNKLRNLGFDKNSFEDS